MHSKITPRHPHFLRGYGTPVYVLYKVDKSQIFFYLKEGLSLKKSKHDRWKREVWHTAPVYPVPSQSQENSVDVCLQMPPFWHGLGVHLSSMRQAPSKTTSFWLFWVTSFELKCNWPKPVMEKWFMHPKKRERKKRKKIRMSFQVAICGVF